MLRYLSVVFLAGAMTTLALGPAVAQPWTLSRSSNGITMRWYSDTNDEAQAHGIAGAYCGATGRGVRLAGIEKDGSAVVARYRCF
jgi:hypothetical protein